MGLGEGDWRSGCGMGWYNAGVAGLLGVGKPAGEIGDMAKESGSSKLAYIVKLLESEGWIKNRETREEVKTLCLADHATLREGRPGDWVAFGADGVIAFGDTQREALDGAHELKLEVRNRAVERLNREPPRRPIEYEPVIPSIFEENVEYHKGDYEYDQEYLTKIFGPDGLLAKHRKKYKLREKARRRYLDEQATLLEEHPREWVAMGVDGVIGFGKSSSEALDAAYRLGFDDTNMVVEFLNPEPFNIPPTFRSVT